MYDIIIIGAGPAGISAGIYAASRGKKTILLERACVGGIIGKVSTVTHYSAIIDGETGATFADRLKQQALNAGISIVYEDVIRTELAGKIKRITTDHGTYESEKIIIAGGSSPRKLMIPGEEELAGKGCGLNAAADGAAYQGKNIYVVGGADGAVKEALYLAQYAKTLTIIHFEEQLGCIAEFKDKIDKTENIRVLLSSRLHGVYGKDCVETLEIAGETGNEIKTVSDPGCGIFIYAGTVPNTGIYPEISLSDGFIPVNNRMETELPGVYAAGDIRVKQVRQVATAVADGAIAAINAAS